MNKILQSVDFGEDISKLTGIFENSCAEQITPVIMDLVNTLADSNFLCYKANMTILQERNTTDDAQAISDAELIARTVGESRVRSKADINKLISQFVKTQYGKEKKLRACLDDDVVYSIGEMLDRILIEAIKRADFATSDSDNATCKYIASKDWSNRVYKCLVYKLNDIEKSGFYECVEEKRTYDLSNVRK